MDQSSTQVLSDQHSASWLRDQFERLIISARDHQIDSFLFDHELSTDELERQAGRIQRFLSLQFGDDSGDRGYRLLAKVIASLDGNTKLVPAHWEAWMIFRDYTLEENRFLRATWNRLKPTSNSIIRNILATLFPIEQKERLQSGLSNEHLI